MSGMSRCITRALDIAKAPRGEWAAALEEVPQTCPHVGICTGGVGCRERLSSYLRVQYRAQMARERTRNRGGR